MWQKEQDLEEVLYRALWQVCSGLSAGYSQLPLPSWYGGKSLSA
jgi:hypothetical protein